MILLETPKKLLASWSLCARSWKPCPTGAEFHQNYAGSAWTRESGFHGATNAGGFRLDDIRASFGYGLRANLGIVVLRFDQAWRTDLRGVADRPESYFSLGADY